MVTWQILFYFFCATMSHITEKRVKASSKTKSPLCPVFLGGNIIVKNIPSTITANSCQVTKWGTVACLEYQKLFAPIFLSNYRHLRGFQICSRVGTGSDPLVPKCLGKSCLNSQRGNIFKSESFIEFQCRGCNIPQ